MGHYDDCRDSAELIAHEAKIARLADRLTQLDYSTLAGIVTTVNENLTRLRNSDPSLTRAAHAYLDEALEAIRAAYKP